MLDLINNNNELIGYYIKYKNEYHIYIADISDWALVRRTMRRLSAHCRVSIQWQPTEWALLRNGQNTGALVWCGNRCRWYVRYDIHVLYTLSRSSDSVILNLLYISNSSHEWIQTVCHSDPPGTVPFKVSKCLLSSHSICISSTVSDCPQPLISCYSSVLSIRQV